MLTTAGVGGVSGAWVVNNGLIVVVRLVVTGLVGVLVVVGPLVVGRCVVVGLVTVSSGVDCKGKKSEDTHLT